MQQKKTLFFLRTALPLTYFFHTLLLKRKRRGKRWWTDQFVSLSRHSFIHSFIYLPTLCTSKKKNLTLFNLIYFFSLSLLLWKKKPWFFFQWKPGIFVSPSFLKKKKIRERTRIFSGRRRRTRKKKSLISFEEKKTPERGEKKRNQHYFCIWRAIYPIFFSFSLPLFPQKKRSSSSRPKCFFL